MTIIQRPSPNFDARHPDKPVSLLVLHYTGMESAEAALAQLTNPAAKVSSHYTIDEDGTVYQHVDEAQRAWHAGRSYWRGESDVNAISIGIEIVNPGHEFGYRPFPDAQIAAVIALSNTLIGRYNIPFFGVVGHSDIAPLRKQDPGEKFPWQHLAKAGVGAWPQMWWRDGGPGFAMGARGWRVREAQRALLRTGYLCPAHGEMDKATVAVVRAFQRRYRQGRCDGILDGETRGLIYAVAALAHECA
ncbi:MAG TPA: N-acetylmuramoyl-L-alanine amidase [Alphaproteobacteria bacterium]|nr:N-acetylmuramoyl-L-alanine amidase [Alphaproteobacteria bacterium]HAJ48392.1 N-acetylmuramoyl-L-alanine amidase [Alphaproteobacteria bacterium]